MDDALQQNVTDLAWFKIFEDGLDVNNQTWGVDRMIANGGKVNFTLPTCIPDGQYLLRHEIIALHSAYNYPGAQFYVSGSRNACAADLRSVLIVVLFYRWSVRS